MTLTLAKDAPAPRRYTVRLHFAEVDRAQADRRVFDVSLQGNEVLKDFNIARQAGGTGRAVVKQFQGVMVTDRLTVSLTPSGGESSSGPVLCGIEAVAQGW